MRLFSFAVKHHGRLEVGLESLFFTAMRWEHKVVVVDKFWHFSSLALDTYVVWFIMFTLWYDDLVCIWFFFLENREVGNVKKPFTPPREVHVQVTHSMPPEKQEIFTSLHDWAEQNVLVHLKHVEKCWQPSDFLPDPSSNGFHDQVKELRERCKEIPDDYFVVLVGDMITEEALPTYQTMINTLDGVRDETGASLTPWAVWTRAWTAEENRHGDLLNKYLYLSGRVDMKEIEKTIQYLIGSGMVSVFT